MESAPQFPFAISICQRMITFASRIVPAAQRDEWRKEWQAEVWHRWRFYVDAGAWNRTEALRLFRNCLGAFVDAACHVAAQEALQHRFQECIRSAWTCLAGVFALLIIVIAASGGLPATRALFTSSGYHDANRLEIVSLRSETGRGERGFHPAIIADWRHENRTLESLAPFRMEKSLIATERRGRVLTNGLAVVTDITLLPMLKVKPTLGSLGTGAALTDGMWRSVFDGDPHVVGSHLRVDGVAYPIVAVLPRNFRFLTRQDAVYLVQPRILNGRVLIAAYPRAGVTDDKIEKDLESIAQDEDFYLFFSRLRLTRVSETLRTPLWYFCAAASLSAILLTILCRVQFERRRFSYRAAAFLSAKVTLMLTIVFAAGLEWNRPGDSILLLWRDSANGPGLVWMYVAGTMAVLFWTLADQRARCRVCLRLLCFPVRVGCPGCLLLDWSGTELLCTEGHGVLHVPDMATSWDADSDRWIALDDSWRELFARN
ncbi:MAG: hypothetical protein WA324_16240 [Bryobacteraceae bacterium]